MSRHQNYAHAYALAVDGNWQDLGAFSASQSGSGDGAFSVAAAAVALLENRPARTMAILKSIAAPLPPIPARIAHWIFGHAAARRAHVGAVGDSLVGYLNWSPRSGARNELDLSEDFRVAESAFRSALALEDVDSLWNDIGVLYFSFGRFEKASRMFQECLSRNPNHRHGTINYAVGLLGQGEGGIAHDFVSRTVFDAQIPSSLVLNQAVYDLISGLYVCIPPRNYKDWTLWSAYSFGWRERLISLFEASAENS